VLNIGRITRNLFELQVVILRRVVPFHQRIWDSKISYNIIIGRVVLWVCVR